MDTILSKTIIRRHGEKKVRKLKNLLSFVAVLAMGAFMFISAIHALDKSIYPGCTVTGQNGRVLTITVDPGIDSGSDGGCLETAKLIRRICLDGYYVQYFGRTIDLAEAERLVALGGEPAPYDPENNQETDR